MKARSMLVALSIALIGCATQALARSPISGAGDGVAIQGYDAVAYFTKKDAVRGVPDHRFEWSGTVWYFSTAENRQLFAATPEKFAPQYGGHCALSVANGRNAMGAGDAWTVLDDKLYLNYSVDVRTRWLRNTSQNIHYADREWPAIRDRLLAR